MSTQDYIDLLFVVAWTYGNGYLFAWLVDPLRPAASRVAATFGFVGLVLVVWGIESRSRRGKFPLFLGYLIFALPFLCSFIGGMFWLVAQLQTWLGIS